MQRLFRYALVTAGSWVVARVVDRVLDRRGEKKKGRDSRK